MRLVLVTEQRLLQMPDGTYWTEQGGDYNFWARYKDAFDEVRLVARALTLEQVPANVRRVDGAGVTAWPLPYYVGPGGYIRNASKISRRIRDAARPCDGVLLRVPSQLGTVLASHRHRAGLPFALEIVGDPFDVFARGSASPPFRPVLRRLFTRNLQRQALNAMGVSYVTERTLQRRYPHAAGAISTHYSSIELGSDAFAVAPRRVHAPIRGARLVSIGSLEQPYKGIDVLLASVARLRASGFPVSLTHLGDGRHRKLLERLATDLGVRQSVTFAGHVLPGEAVRRHLQAADVFVLPSRTEGLPRALIEAMALAVPAVASTAGGSPELLDPAQLVNPGDAVELAEALRILLSDPQELSRTSEANLRRAQYFHNARLGARRRRFYQALRRSFEDSLRR